MEEERNALFIFDDLFDGKTIDDLLDFTVDDVEADSSDQLLVMDEPSPAYLSWTAEAQALIANFAPQQPPHHHQHSPQSLTTVNADSTNDFFTATADDITTKTVDIDGGDASFPCDDEAQWTWLSQIDEDSYSPTDTTATAVDTPSKAYTTNYCSIDSRFRASGSSTARNPLIKGYYHDDDDDTDQRFIHNRTPSPVSVIDRSFAGYATGGVRGTRGPLLVQVPNPKITPNASSAFSYSSSSSSSPTSSSGSGAFVSRIKVHGPRSPPESFVHAHTRAPRTKRSRPPARAEALVPIVPPMTLPPPSHGPSPLTAAAADSDDLLPVPELSFAPIYIPVPRPTPASGSTTTTPTNLSADESSNAETEDGVPKKKKIKLTITSSAAAAVEAAVHHHAATDANGARKCMHCGIQKTPQWRAGPMGPKTLCNACGVRYKSGRLFPEYRPAASPTFVPSIHSNSHKKVVEMRNKSGDTKNSPPMGVPVSSKGCELLNYIRVAAKTYPPPAAPTATAGGSGNRDW